MLMHGIAFALGDSQKAFGIALIVQAIIFGLVHAYQGPAGIVEATINGLIQQLPGPENQPGYLKVRL